VLALAVLTTARPALAAGVSDQIRCLALTIYYEARGEPKVGKIAVGHVVMNRVRDAKFPNDVCAVVRQGGERPRFRCQFSWWCDGRSDTPHERAAWRVSRVLAQKIFWGFSADPTGGALWYHATYVKPTWRRAYQRGPTVGRHTFYRRASGIILASQRALSLGVRSN